MQEQNFSNHARYHGLYHFFTAPLVLIGLIGSIINYTNSAPENKYSASLLVLVFFILLILGWLVRGYALKAQDRAIRAEENLRHFILTGKALDSKLRIGQIVALRFASDEEFPALAAKAAAENMSGKSIKQSIQNWKPDHNRV
jgi:cbb3-type cytochrome oxidase subunit 3